MLATYGLLFLFGIIATIFALYFFHIFVAPRKIEEIAKMIDTGQAPLAIKRLTEILEKDDRNPYAHYLLAEAYLKEKNIQYAILEYRQVLKLGKFDDRVKEVDIRSRMASLYKATNAMEEAKKEYLILTQLDPSHYINYYELGVIYFESGMFEKALSYLKKSISSNKNHDMSYYYLGQTYYRMEMFREAKQVLLEALKIDHSNYKAHYFLGLVLRQLGDHEWAIKEFEVAGRDEDIKVKCFLAKGTCFLEREQYPRAVQELERGLKYARKGSATELNLRYFLADAQEKMKDLHAAISNWEAIIKVKKDFRDVQQKLKSYEDFKQDDRLKDFLIAPLSQFEHTCRKLVEAMDYTIIDIDLGENDVEVLAIEPEGRFRNIRRSNRIIKLFRTTDVISDNTLRKLSESMKRKNANRIIVITTSDFSTAAMEFANTRPIDLYGRNKLVELLKKIQ